eukprot:NODE_11257_length_1298_cov_7.263877.p1 GENE.NODE_11257_length_1298_cov_7.263877~~NODE_11257_length_1298_cov_7.263877.p1  ORF type:complete len:361 (-),score=115.84 NODE_11257_length_1298_cov_7.263877:216-1238(-)
MEPATKKARADRPAVWLDCDPGHDDALAIVLAGYRCNLLGISTVYGNQTIEKTSRNAARMCKAAAIDVPVYVGASQPIVRGKHTPDDEIHGESGLDGCAVLDALPVDNIKEGKAILKMAECISTFSGEGGVTIVATGCLTNVALFVRLFPELLPKVAQIVFMGGAVRIGNRSAAAEFNIICDPEAASIVCDCGIKVVMVPLDVTHTALATEDVFRRIAELRSPLAGVLVDVISFFRNSYKQTFGFESPPVHDPCAVAYVLNPALFDAPLYHVEVDCTTGPCAGRTVVDLYNQASNKWNRSKKSKNVHVALKMDVGGFWDLMLDAFAEASERATALATLPA